MAVNASLRIRFWEVVMGSHFCIRKTGTTWGAPSPWITSFLTMLRCHRDFTLVFISQPVVKLVSFYVISLKVAEQNNDIRSDLPVFQQRELIKELVM